MRLISLIATALLWSVGALADSVTSYRLGSGDQISIQVFGEEDLTMEVRLSDQRTISYPFLGHVEVQNRTTSEVEESIREGLRGDYLIEPRVNVSVTEYRPFFITGEVKEPGSYPFQPGLTLRKAISLAGGFTERASRSKIYVDKKSADLSVAVSRKIVDLDDLVHPDDVITVQQSFF